MIFVSHVVNDIDYERSWVQFPQRPLFFAGLSIKLSSATDTLPNKQCTDCNAFPRNNIFFPMQGSNISKASLKDLALTHWILLMLTENGSYATTGREYSGLLM
jgi:hypothetical protein